MADRNSNEIPISKHSSSKEDSRAVPRSPVWTLELEISLGLGNWSLELLGGAQLRTFSHTLKRATCGIFRGVMLPDEGGHAPCRRLDAPSGLGYLRLRWKIKAGRGRGCRGLWGEKKKKKQKETGPPIHADPRRYNGRGNRGGWGKKKLKEMEPRMHANARECSRRDLGGNCRRRSRGNGEEDWPPIRLRPGYAGQVPADLSAILSAIALATAEASSRRRTCPP